MKEYDVVIIGGGIAGYSAALRAAELGASVCLVEKGRLGGTYFFNGLYPLRLVLQSLGMMNWVNPALRTEFGFSGNGTPDYQPLFEKAREVAETLSQNAQKNLREKNVRLMQGIGVLVNAEMVRIDFEDSEEVVKTRAVILAMGSYPKAPPALPFDDSGIVPNDSLLDLKDLPEKILVVGGNVLGCELATVLNRLGAKVFLCEKQERVISGQDPDILNQFEEQLKKQKIKLLLNKNILSILKKEENIDITLEGSIKFNVDKVIYAGSRKPDSETIKNTGIRLGEHGEVLVDEKMATSMAGVYAIGGVTRGSHDPVRSEEEARVAAGNALGKSRILDQDRLPFIMYSDPEWTRVGCIGSEAHHKGFRAVEGSCQLDDLDQFSGVVEKAGILKLVVDKTNGKTIGFHFLSKGASEILPLAMLAIKKELSITDLANLSTSWPLRFKAVRHAAKEIIHSLKSAK